GSESQLTRLVRELFRRSEIEQIHPVSSRHRDRTREEPLDPILATGAQCFVEDCRRCIVSANGRQTDSEMRQRVQQNRDVIRLACGLDPSAAPFQRVFHAPGPVEKQPVQVDDERRWLHADVAGKGRGLVELPATGCWIAVGPGGACEPSLCGYLEVPTLD